MTIGEDHKAWAHSEDRHDPSFADLVKVRLSTDTLVDDIQTTLAVRYPFIEVSRRLGEGALYMHEYLDLTGQIQDSMLETGRGILGAFNRANTTKQNKIRGKVNGYLAELSFLLLMNHAAEDLDVVTVPSPIKDDILSGTSRSGDNLSYDALVFAQEKWHKIQVKSYRKNATPEAYDESIVVVRPPLLPVEVSPDTGLRTNVFNAFTSIRQGEADEATLDNVNKHARRLLKYVQRSAK